MNRPFFVLLPLLLTAVLSRPAAAQAIDAYGYDAAGQYHVDGPWNSPALHIDTNVDLSAFKAQMERDFAPPTRPAPQPWYDDSDYEPPARSTSAPAETHVPSFMEDMTRKAEAGDKDALAFVSMDAFYFGGDYPKAVGLLQKSSDAGNHSSMEMLYHLLLDKDKGVRDVDRAAKLLPLLAAKGDPEYEDTYGQALMAGDHFPKDAVRGLALRESAAGSEGCGAELCYNLGHDYEIGRGMEPNVERAIHWYLKAHWYPTGPPHRTPEFSAKLTLMMLSQKDCLRTYRDDLGRMLADPYFPSPLSDADRTSFTAKIATALAQGGKAPQNPATVVGQLLTDPRFGTPDYDLAAKLFKDNSDPAAEREQGRMYETGRGVDRDHEQALKLFHKAADGDDGAAYFYLAVDGLRKWQAEKQAHGNTPEAAGMRDDSERAAEQGTRCGDVRAKCLHAEWLYHDAQESHALTTEDKSAQFAQARKLWQEAADAGVAQATYFLGVTAEQGQGTPKDLPGAVKLFRQAAGAGYPAAQEKLAILMLTGQDGVAKDVPGGRALLEKAAPSLPSAADELAVSLWHGPDGPAHGAEVQKWLQQAFDGGYWVAGRNLAKFWHVGFGGVKDEAQARACLDKAAAMGGREAAKVAAEAYAKGDAVTADPAAAAKWKAIAQQ